MVVTILHLLISRVQKIEHSENRLRTQTDTLLQHCGAAQLNATPRSDIKRREVIGVHDERKFRYRISDSFSKLRHHIVPHEGQKGLSISWPICSIIQKFGREGGGIKKSQVISTFPTFLRLRLLLTNFFLLAQLLFLIPFIFICLNLQPFSKYITESCVRLSI